MSNLTPVNRPHATIAAVLGNTRLEVNHTLWTPPGSVPETWAEVSWSSDGLVCRLIKRESTPRVTYLAPNDPVHKDSCLEWFLSPWPGTGRYLNLEANAAGTLYAAIGTSTERPLLDDDLRALVGCAAEVDDEQWSVTYTVPQRLLDALADLEHQPRVVLARGLRVEANLYACGDDTAVEHYGAWSPIEAPSPQFHRPDWFGAWTLG